MHHPEARRHPKLQIPPHLRILPVVVSLWAFLGWGMSCVRAEETNILTIKLELRNGYVRVDTINSKLTLRGDYQKWFKGTSNQMFIELTGYLDNLFVKRGKVVEQLMIPGARGAWKDGVIRSRELDGWDRTNCNWDMQFVGKLNTWVATHTNLVAGDAKNVYDGLLGSNPEKPLDPGYELSPIEPFPEIIEDSSFIHAVGLIQYTVASPITANYINPRPRERIGDRGSWPGTISSNHLSRTLKKLEGQLWFRSKVERELVDYLESRGVPVELEPVNSRQGPDDRAGLKIERPRLKSDGNVEHNRILFSNDPLLAGIYVRVPPADVNGLRRALYMILPSDDFDSLTPHLDNTNYFQRVFDPFSQTEGQTNEMVHLDLQKAPGSGLRVARQYMTGRFMAERLRYLEIIGFSAEKWNGQHTATSRTNRYKTIELVVTPRTRTVTEQNGGGVEFVAGDVINLPSFATKLRKKTDDVSAFVFIKLDPATQKAADEYDGSESNATVVLRTNLVKGLNRVLHQPDVFQTNRFSAVQMRDDTKALINEHVRLLETRKHTFEGNDLSYFNRMLLEDAYPEELATNRLSKVRYDRGTNYAHPSSFEAESSRRAEEIRRASYEPEFPNFFRVGAEYTPKQPLRYFAGYTRAGLNESPNVLSGQIGWQDGVFGDATYTRDFLFFDSLNRRLQTSLRGFSDYQPERLLAGQEVDERRSGGEASANLDLLRDWHRHWLRLDLAAGYRRVDLTGSSQKTNDENLVTGDFGMLYLYRWDATPGSARLEFQPNVRLGYADHSEDMFIVPSAHATYHRFLGSWLQWECNAHVAGASSDTPYTEWPTLGGESSVRGYRADAGVGRTSWAIQNEIWLPLRYNLGLPAGIDRVMRRNLALAPFVDVGGVNQTRDEFSGTKIGAGVGLRFIYNDFLTLRLDWAHAIDESDEKRGGSMFYFSVTTRRGF